MSDQATDKETRAADYVLGTLNAAERAGVERELINDPELAQMVDAWNRRLAPLADSVAPVVPPERVWREVRRAMGAHHDVSSPTDLDGLFKRLQFWRWCTAGVSVLAGTLALYIAIVLPTPEYDTRYVAVLNEGATTPSWVVTVDIARREMTIRPLADVALADGSFELWLIEGTNTPPMSLGLLDPHRARSVAVSQSISEAATTASVLAISLEPEGGSPTGLPTGPVVFQGPLLAVTD